MKEIPLTQGYVALVDDADFDWLNQWKWYMEPKKLTQYARRSCWKFGKKCSISMHRFILGVTDPKIQVDHKDVNGLNNQRSNLRLCTSSQNNHNTRAHKKSSSKYKGVYIKNGDKKWSASIKINGKIKHLGSFENEIDAAIRYNEVASTVFGEFARLNIIEP